jgi:integrase
MPDLPNQIHSMIDELDVKDSSRQCARNDIVDYAEWVVEQNENGEFPTGDEPEKHVKFVNSYLKAQKKQGYARQTIASRWTWITRFYKEISMNLLNDYAFLSENPIEILEDKTGKTRQDYLPEQSEKSQRKQNYYVDKDDLELLCDNVPSPAFRNETLLRLAWTTGLRSSEIVNLKVENVNVDQNLLEEFWVPKTAESRSLWIPDTTAWFLEQYFDAGYRKSFSYAGESEHLFLTNAGPKMSDNFPTKIVNEAAANAGIQEVLGTDKSGHERTKVTMHALRRGHGMHLWKEGESLSTIQKRLGHSRPSQTDDYLPIDVEESKEKLSDVTF